jgi:hypothetical protein
MKLVHKDQDLRDLEVMLEQGSHKIVRVGWSSLSMDYYVIKAPGSCRTVYSVPCSLRPDWGKRFYRGGK